MQNIKIPKMQKMNRKINFLDEFMQDYYFLR